ncbi:MAG: dependent oxidoreductase [Gemmatimonadetes bacterium]|nr:dependent oxidoreductase [Gemmatimonadota bacterium]
MKTYDVIVAGLGVHGSAAADSLAQRGLRVLGLDRYSPPHTTGSSHGGSRIIREAYFEDGAYVPLVRRAYELWHDLEQRSGETLLIPTGGMTIGPPHGALVRGARQSAVAHGVPYEELSSHEAAARFPDFRLNDDMVGIFERRAGVLLPEMCVSALLSQARTRGATIQLGEALLAWEATPGGVEVRTTQGRYAAQTLVLAAGAWLPDLLGGLQLGLWVERQVMHWFDSVRPAAAGQGAPMHNPVTIWEYEPERMFYTLPDMGQGTKAAFHHDGERGAADAIRREVSDEEIHAVEAIVARHVPGLQPHSIRSATCLYTNTPDQHFLIDAHPDHPNVVIASACSGHGFKFAPAVGEIVGNLVTGVPDAAPDLFSAKRLARSSS